MKIRTAEFRKKHTIFISWVGRLMDLSISTFGGSNQSMRRTAKKYYDKKDKPDADEEPSSKKPKKEKKNKNGK